MRQSWWSASRPGAQGADEVPETFRVDVQPERDLVRALHMVIEINTAAVNDGFEFAIAPGPPPVHRTFELTGLDTRLPFTRPGPEENGRAPADADAGRTPSRG